MPQVYIVIPCYNETEVVKTTIEGLLHFKYEIVLVDDGSHLVDIEKSLQAMPIHYLRHDINLGQGAALQTGMEYAYKQGADYVIHFDADGQHSAQDIPAMLAPLLANDWDICLGSRFIKSEHTALIPKGRRRLLKVARVINGLITGLWLSDAHNGFRAMNKVALQKIKITKTAWHTPAKY